VREGMVDSCKSFLGDVVADIINEEAIVDAVLMGIVVFNGPDLLGCEEYAGSIEEKIECLFGEAALDLRVVFGNEGVEVEEVLVDATEELELEFVIDFDQWVDPIHCSYNYIIKLD
jgi:hypothetical protein